MPPIRFTAKLSKVGSSTIVRLPRSASIKLPSRGMDYVEGTINGLKFRAALEPDGKGSHWLMITKKMKVAEGDTAILAIRPVEEWPEPEIPADLKRSLVANPTAYETWKDITPMARWDWIRWIRSTKNPETRKKRIRVTFSKFRAGKRRPCCFNRSICTDTSVSNNGVLIG